MPITCSAQCHSKTAGPPHGREANVNKISFLLKFPLATSGRSCVMSMREPSWNFRFHKCQPSHFESFDNDWRSLQSQKSFVVWINRDSVLVTDFTICGSSASLCPLLCACRFAFLFPRTHLMSGPALQEVEPNTRLLKTPSSGSKSLSAI